MSPSLVMVEWLDAWVNGVDSINLNDPDPKHGPTKMQTIGWLLKDDEKGVSLFNERCLDVDDQTYRGRTFIPRAMITKVEPLNDKKPRTVKRARLPVPLNLAET